MLETLTEKLTALLNSTNLFAAIYSFESNEFKEDPVVTITPSDNESDYRTTSENRRVYAFNVRLFVQRTEPRTDTETERILRGLVDRAIDTFDKNYTLSGLVVPTGYTMIMVEAAPSNWFYMEREVVYRVAEIKLKIHMDINVNLIS